MLRETPDAADAIIDMIVDLDEIDETCAEKIKVMQQQAKATVAA